MSEHEFDAYLALLGGMLGLSEEQRESIAGELRDHMLERMHELMTGGVPRQKAIQRALEEFGDASRLAAGLAAAASLQRRRLIMRWTFGTVVSFGLLLFIGLAYWPEGENGPGPQVSVGQQQEAPAADVPEPEIVQVPPRNVSLNDDPNERAFSALQQSIDVDTTESPVPLSQFVRGIARQIGLQLVIDLPENWLKHLDTPVGLQFSDVPAFTALSLAMSPTNSDITFTIRDGALVIVDTDRYYGIVRLYPVGDLLSARRKDAEALMTPNQSLVQLVNERQKLLLAGKATEAEQYDNAIVAAADMMVRYAQWQIGNRPQLVTLLQGIVQPEQWDITGGPYSMQTYGNVLVVFASVPIHWEITQTLARLRKYAIGEEGTAQRLPNIDDSVDAAAAPGAAVGRAGGAAPRDAAKIPPYIIEPPDILLIKATKAVPKPPYKLEVFDVVVIRVIGVFEELGQPIAEAYSIQPDGTVDLGPTYGRVKLVGTTTKEAADAIQDHLRQFVESPNVNVALAAATGAEKIDGQHLVGPDGRVNLGGYGQVYVAGKTLIEAKAAIEQKLAEKLEDPEVVLDIFAYNSKVYYVITQGEGRGDNVVRMPITGNETVLDAISNAVGLRGGFSRLSTKKIWISRSAPNGIGAAQTLPVDWEAITREGDTSTNHQILPGDRIFIAPKQPDDADATSFNSGLKRY